MPSPQQLAWDAISGALSGLTLVHIDLLWWIRR